jgi:hypothetical protein
MGGERMTNDEISKVKEDSEWWTMVGKILGLTLLGFTYRSSALFVRKIMNDDGTYRGPSYEIDNYMANAILLAAGKP